MSAALHRAIARAAKWLPWGYEIQLRVENGSATVSLLRPNGTLADLPDAADRAVSEQVRDAVMTALREHHRSPAT